MKAFKGGLLGCLGVGAAIVIVIIVIAVIASGGRGSSNTSSPSSTARPKASVGQAMKNDANQTVTVVSFKRGVSSGNEFLKPSPGNECVQVNLAFVNGDSHPWMLPLSEMAVVDANGQSHSESFSCGSSATIDSLIPNGKATATLFFETPVGSTLDLRWTPNILNANSYYDTSLK